MLELKCCIVEDMILFFKMQEVKISCAYRTVFLPFRSLPVFFEKDRRQDGTGRIPGLLALPVQKDRTKIVPSGLFAKRPEEKTGSAFCAYSLLHIYII